MGFQKSSIELMKERTSSRSYDDRKLDRLALQKLTDYIVEINEAKKISGKFVLVQNNTTKESKTKPLGTYGVISGASSFVVGILDKNGADPLMFGYLFEKIVLYATDLGIQTCWLGGTFNKGDFEQNITLSDNEFIPIVSPIGYRKEKPRVFESVMRTAIGANKRKAWGELFFEHDTTTPLDETRAGLYGIPLEMVRLGPSASNKQPWRIIKDNEVFHFFLCRTKGYGLASYDIQKNDIGIAQCHFELAAKELGLQGRWKELEPVSIPAGWEYIVSWNESQSSEKKTIET